MRLLCWLGMHNWSPWRGAVWDSDGLDYVHLRRKCWRCRKVEET